MRQAKLTRKTNETDISVSVDLDGTGKSNINTGVGFLDHMLDQVARHGMIDIDIKANGDLHIDAHHTTEDVASHLDKRSKKRWAIKRASDVMPHAICQWMKPCLAQPLIFRGGPSLCGVWNLSATKWAILTQNCSKNGSKHLL